MAMKVVCPGSFDPITRGHEDYIRKAAGLFGCVEVLVMNNTEKKYMFSAKERFEAARLAFEGDERIRVVLCEGLLAGYCRENNVAAIVKGVRGAADSEYEITLAEINREIGGVESILFPTESRFSFISSTFVRNMIKYGEDYSKFVPENSYIYLKKITTK